MASTQMRTYIQPFSKNLTDVIHRIRYRPSPWQVRQNLSGK
jgi:hypothetical protein